MANKKKNTRQSSKLKKSSGRKPTPKQVVRKTAATKKKNALKKAVRKKPVPRKKSVAAKLTPKKAAATQKSTATKKVASRKPASKKVRGPGRAQGLDAEGIERNLLRARAGIQSGDLQGLSRRVGAASESVDELVEEGNAFEAGIVQGIEAADDSDEEVLSHEVIADDVPGEYLDED